jgi:hypothetical protein
MRQLFTRVIYRSIRFSSDMNAIVLSQSNPVLRVFTISRIMVWPDARAVQPTLQLRCEPNQSAAGPCSYGRGVLNKPSRAAAQTFMHPPSDIDEALCKSVVSALFSGIRGILEGCCRTRRPASCGT